MIAANLAERGHRKFGFTIKLTLLNAFQMVIGFAHQTARSRLKLQLTGWTIMPCQLVVVSSLVILSCWNRRRQNP